MGKGGYIILILTMKTKILCYVDYYLIQDIMSQISSIFKQVDP
jgi:hypothetical protein